MLRERWLIPMSRKVDTQQEDNARENYARARILHYKNSSAGPPIVAAARPTRRSIRRRLPPPSWQRTDAAGWHPPPVCHGGATGAWRGAGLHTEHSPSVRETRL